jgi:hypothetical protein
MFFAFPDACRTPGFAVDLLSFEETRRATGVSGGGESRPANGGCRTTIVLD